MLRLAVVLALLSVLSCSQDKPTAQAAFDEEAGPWETVEINGATYKCVAGQPQSVSGTNQSDLLITIPIRKTTWAMTWIQRTI